MPDISGSISPVSVAAEALTRMFEESGVLWLLCSDNLGMTIALLSTHLRGPGVRLWQVQRWRCACVRGARQDAFSVL